MQALALLALTVVSSPDASSGYTLDDPPPERRLFVRSLTALRANPLGALEIGYVSLRSRLYESNELLFKQNYVGFGPSFALSPAFARVGAQLEIQPLTILRLWGRYEVSGYFGSFDLFQSFESANDEHSDTVIDDLGARNDDDPAHPYATTGSMLSLGATLQLKVGPVAARSLFQAVNADFVLREGDRVYYSQIFDLLVPNGGWFVTNDVDVLWISDFGLVAGVRWAFSKADYGPNHFRPGEADAELNPAIHRLGPLVAYTFYKEPAGSAFNNPTLLLLANWHLTHRYRTGTDVSAGVPYIALALLFTGDLWNTPKR